MAHAMYDTKSYKEALEYFKKLLGIKSERCPFFIYGRHYAFKE